MDPVLLIHGFGARHTQVVMTTKDYSTDFHLSQAQQFHNKASLSLRKSIVIKMACAKAASKLPRSHSLCMGKLAHDRNPGVSEDVTQGPP